MYHVALNHTRQGLTPELELSVTYLRPAEIIIYFIRC